MLIVERQEHVIKLLKEQKTIELEELARILDVSSSTIRRDLEQLEEQGLVQRTRAGAIYKGTSPQPPGGGHIVNVAARLNERVREKQAIGKILAGLILPQMTVLLDGGSTIVHGLEFITARPIQVVTNSLLIANHFADDEHVELLLIGGSLYPRSGVTVGPIANGCLAELHADLFIFSVSGVFDNDVYNINLPMAQVEQLMMQQAASSVLAVDSTKFQRKSLVRVCSLDEVDQIITDDQIDLSWREKLGDRLIVAPAE